jgi:hypothetical protein
MEDPIMGATPVNVDHLPNDTLHLLYEVAAQHAVDPDTSLVWHTPSVSAREKEAILAREKHTIGADAHVQKTITIRLPDRRLVLCTGVGDFSLSRPQLKAIVAALGLPASMAKSCTINPPDCRPEETFEMRLGMVSPFPRPRIAHPVAAVAVLPLPTEWSVAGQYGAISLSLHKSLLIPLLSLLSVLREYARRAYPQLRLLEL